jgi:hypothetical protein
MTTEAVKLSERGIQYYLDQKRFDRVEVAIPSVDALAGILLTSASQLHAGRMRFSLCTRVFGHDDDVGVSMRCSEPGGSVVVAIVASPAPGR